MRASGRRSVVAITTSYPLSPNDGNAPFIREICQALSESGVDVDVVLPHHERLNWECEDGDVSINSYRYLPRWLNREALWGYGQAMESDRALKLSAIAIAPVALAISTLRLLRLAQSQEVDLIHAHWLLPNGLPAAVVGMLTGVDFAVSVHGSDVHLVQRSGLARAIGRWIAARAASITVCSSDLQAKLTQTGIPETKTQVVPYGVDVSFFSPEGGEKPGLKEALGLEDDVFLVGAVGRLVEKKGFDVLVRAVSLASEIRLVVAGDGPEGERLQKLADTLGIGDRVYFIGAANRLQVRNLYRSVDVLAVPSVVDSAGNVDGLPNVLLEGLASGCAVIASRVAGIPDVLEHEVNGLLVEPGDHAALADSLSILTADRTLRMRIKAGARRLAAEELTWSKVVAESPYIQDLENAYQSRLHTR